MSSGIDYQLLFKLRAVIARFGEMDRARWWNTHGLLGRRGASVLRRGFPTTHYFAQARLLFAVARQRCKELYDPPEAITLWSLPADIEDEFEDHWQRWLRELDVWSPFFQDIEAIEDDLQTALRSRGLVSQTHLDTISKLRRTAEGRALALPGDSPLCDETIILLAAGFTQGDMGSPVIPYAKLVGSRK